MSKLADKLPNIHVRGTCSFRVQRDDEGREEEITFKQSPMMTKFDAAEYVGLGAVKFLALVRSGVIPKRGEGHKAYHVDDLDEFLETLREDAY